METKPTKEIPVMSMWHDKLDYYPKEMLEEILKKRSEKKSNVNS